VSEQKLEGIISRGITLVLGERVCMWKLWGQQKKCALCGAFCYLEAGLCCGRDCAFVVGGGWWDGLAWLRQLGGFCCGGKSFFWWWGGDYHSARGGWEPWGFSLYEEGVSDGRKQRAAEGIWLF